MQCKDRPDELGLGLMLLSTPIFGINQVVIKVVDVGSLPVFFTGLRRVWVFICIWGWMAFRGRPPRNAPGTLGVGMLVVWHFRPKSFVCSWRSTR